MTIKQLPSGNYRTQLFDFTDGDGKRHYKSITAPTKTEVKRLAAEFTASKAQKKTTAKYITVENAIIKYIASKNNVLSPSTIRGYNRLLANHYDSIKKINLKQLTDDDIQLYINEESPKVSPKTIRNIYGLLHSALKASKYFISEEITLPQKEKNEIQIPTNDDMRRIFDHIYGKRIELAVYLAAICGMRRGEICALRTSDIDIEHNLIRIHRSVALDNDNTLCEKSPKTVAGNRTIRIFAPVLEVIKRTKFQDEYVVPFRRPDSLTACFATQTGNLNMSYTFHSLRHFAVSSMISLNMPKKYIIEYVGHENEEMVDKVYAHVMEDRMEDYMQKIDDYYSENFRVQHDLSHD